MRATFGLILALVSLAPAGAASRKTIEFSHDYCDYRLSFDPARIDEPRLRASVSLLYGKDNSFDHEPGLITSRDKAVAFDLQGYRAWCATEESRLRGLDLLDIPGLEDLRQRRMAEHADRCQLVTAEVLGGRGDIGGLRAYARGLPVCVGYIDALTRSDADFVPAWRAYAEQSCRRNSNRPDCKNKDLAWLKKPDGVERLREDLLTFGWYNCANRLSFMNEGDDGVHGPDGTRLRDAVAARFKKSLKVKSLGCDTGGD